MRLSQNSTTFQYPTPKNIGTKKRLTVDADANCSEVEEIEIMSTTIDLTDPVTTMDITSDEGVDRDAADSWDVTSPVEIVPK